MEMQFFTSEQGSEKWFEYWRSERRQQLLSLGLKETELHFKTHSKEELAHYAKKAEDIEFDFPWGRRELEGLHNRGAFDLSRHQQFSGKKLQYFCPEQNKSYLPYVIETSIGADRLFLAVLCSAYTEETVKNETRKLLKLKSHIAPVQIAVLPLSKKPALTSLCEKLYSDLQKNWFAEYDASGSIGKRYRRQDEIGTPFCATIDFETCEDNKLTVRERDSMRQERIPIESLNAFLKDNLS